MRVPLVLLIAASVGACDASPPTSPRRPPSSPLADIQDAAHNGGVAGFYFLSPLVATPVTAGTPDGTLSPVVQVCEWNGACVATVAMFTTTSGTGGAVVRYDDPAYHVNWKTDACVTGPCTLDPNKRYRVIVTANGVKLGHADVQPVTNGSQLKNIDTRELIGLVDGRTLPVKFRVEAGLVAAITVNPSPANVAPGSSVALSATAVDLHGNPLSLSYDWMSSDNGMATVNGSGVVTGVASGTATISASAGGRSGYAVVIVQALCDPLPSGLTHWWRGDGDAADAIGGDHGIVQGTVTYAPGRVGQAFQFGNGYLKLNGAYGGPSTQEITVMAWVRTQASGPSAWQAILSSTDPSFVHFQTSAVGGSAVYTQPGPGFNEIQAPGPFPLDVWRHFALTAKSGAIRFYLDGAVYTASNSVFTSITAAPQVLIGRGYGFDRPFPGLVDELQMYNRALSESEIQAVMALPVGVAICVP